jgi:galactitol-specific phosphotransferase system IIC component
MSNNSWGQTLAVLKVAGPAVVNTTTASSLLGTGAGQDARFNLPSNFLNVGSRLRLLFDGQASTAVAATLTFSVQIGAVTVYTGTATPALGNALSNSAFDGEINLTCTAVGGGTNAAITGNGKLSGLALSPSLVMAGATGSGFDSTASGFVDLFVAWSVANAGNTVNLYAGGYELLSRN